MTPRRSAHTFLLRIVTHVRCRFDPQSASDKPPGGDRIHSAWENSSHVNITHKDWNVARGLQIDLS